MRREPRVDYDPIAPHYDAQPHRARPPDPDLLAFAAERNTADLAVLDVGCGTGNQVIANRNAAPRAWYVGLDRSLGMLRQARRKAPDIPWVQGAAARLPFPAASLDFVCCQFAFHHIAEKAEMLRAGFRVLRPGGRFAMCNLCPQESRDWLYYQYFPEALAIDLEDFWPVDAVLAAMRAAGFAGVAAACEHIRFDQDLSAWLDTVRHRDTCSQLQAISDAAYQAGVERLQAGIADPDAPRVRQHHLCLVRIRGEVPRPHRRSIDGRSSSVSHRP